MLGTLIVGLGHAGARLHLPAVLRIRRAMAAYGTPLVGVDANAPATPDIARAGSIEEAAAMTDPASTVVHVCTPPSVRLELLCECVAAGFRRFVVEKPLALDEADLAAVLALAREHGLDMLVVGQWLCSVLTQRLRDLLAGGAFGRLRSVLVWQSKPRFARSLTSAEHPTAFDVEIPHAIGLVRALAGAAQLTGAGYSDLALPDATRPHLGSAWLTLDHGTISSRIDSILTAPLRERRIELRFDFCSVIGHYPCSDADHYARLETRAPSGTERAVFPDDSLTEYMLRAYQHFTGERPWPDNLAFHAEGARLLAEAKSRCGITEPRAARVG